MSNSIRGRLALLVLASIALVWTIALGWSYRQATREVGEWDDARLVQLAQLIVLLDQNDLSVLSMIRIDARTEYGHRPGHASDSDGDKLPREALFQVRDADGRVLAGSAKLVSPGAFDAPAEATAGSRLITLGGRAWHSYVLHHSASGRAVRVLESTNSRSGCTACHSEHLSARPAARRCGATATGKACAPTRRWRRRAEATIPHGRSLAIREDSQRCNL